MKKTTLILISTLILLGCSSANIATRQEVENTHSATEITSSTNNKNETCYTEEMIREFNDVYRRSYENPVFSKYPGLFTRKKDSLTVNLPKYKHTFEDNLINNSQNCGNCSSKVFTLWDYSAVNNFLIIQELCALNADCSDSYLIIDTISGKEIVISNYISDKKTVSSDGQYIIDHGNFNDGPCGFVPFEIFQRTNKGFVSVFKLDLELLQEINKKVYSHFQNETTNNIFISSQWQSSDIIEIYTPGYKDNKTEHKQLVFTVQKKNSAWELNNHNLKNENSI